MNVAVATRSPAEVESGLRRLELLAALDRYLAVSVTTDADGRPQVAVVNVGIIAHPATGTPSVGFVARRGAKLANLRARPEATLVIRAGWEWIAVCGPVTLVGPDDNTAPALNSERMRSLFRDIFSAAGGEHPDLARYDEVMAAERRCAVLVTPERFVTNPPGSEHREPEE